MFLQEAPLEAAFSVPIYSNGGYQILAYALEAITNRTMSESAGFPDHIEDSLSEDICVGSVATPGRLAESARGSAEQYNNTMQPISRLGPVRRSVR